MTESQEDRTKPKNEVVKTPRKCLMHGGLFMSEGVGNRICDKCKQSKTFMSASDTIAYNAPGFNRKGPANAD